MKPRVLIVDDEFLNRVTLEAFLRQEGYDLFFAANGFEACEQAEALQPDVILLDIMMPDMDGFSVCRRIRGSATIGRIPILVITALDDDDSRLEGLRAGADDFVSKPCRREELRARVRTIVSLNRFRAIAEQRERFQRLYEMAPVAIVLADLGAKALAANPVAETLFGSRKGATLVGSTLPRWFEAGHAAAVQQAIDRAISGVEVPAPVEVRRGQGSEIRVLRLRASAVPEGGGSCALLVFEDITTEIRAQESLARSNSELDEMVRARTRQLEEANGLLMSYASFVSHDLRSPLTVMKGYLSMVQEGLVPINAEAAPLVEQAFQATVVMQELVQNILQLAQDEHEGAAGASATTSDPAAIIGRVWRHLSGFHPHARRSFDIGALPAVGVSAVVVERVFYNLLANAMKFSAQRPEPRIEVGAQPAGEGVVIFVRDNGVGFNGRDADRLFREFSRLENSTRSEGFGLGLSLVARLVRAHGGRIWAEGEAGHGATFYVRLPAPRAAATHGEVVAVGAG